MKDLRILHIPNECTGCGACANRCPKTVIAIKQNEEGFYYPVVDETRCVECGLCEKTCHILNPIEDTKGSALFFMYRTNDENLLQESSSGGAFTLFANYFLSESGVVYGSTYDGLSERLRVISTDQVDLSALRKSKYIESYTGHSFTEIKNHLMNGRKVLYCGTPCQVSGLKHYLKSTKTPIDCLLTIDFACHGVPSNGLFNMFKSMLESPKRRLVAVDFRHKDFSSVGKGWHNPIIKFFFSDGTTKEINRNSYYYYFYRLFSDDLSLRKCCYSCNRLLSSQADISIGDFWGLGSYKPELDDNKGMSYVKVNNDSILPLWEELSSSGYVERLPIEAVSYQYKERIKDDALKKRNAFSVSLQRKGLFKTIISYYGINEMFRTIVLSKLKHKVINSIKR